MTLGHRKTKRTFDTPGDARFVTFSCFKRWKLLDRDRTRTYFIDAVAKAKAEIGFDLWAYVIMPEHAHLVILPRSDVKLQSILSCIKLSVSRKAVAYLKKHAPAFLQKLEDVQPNGKRAHRFWQRGGGYDRNLRSVRDIHEKIAYTHENPVRRGLVPSPLQWKWSSAAAWENRTDLPLPIDRETVPPLTPTDDHPTSRLWQ